jgi:hypothetical protein
MRYRLRTLLIVLAIVGVVFARIGYLKRMGDYHQQEAARLLTIIASAQGEDQKKVADSIRNLASVGKIPGRGYGSNGVVVLITGKKLNNHLAKDAATADVWDLCVCHQVLADRYDHAVYRPWRQVLDTITDARGNPPDAPHLKPWRAGDGTWPGGVVVVAIALFVGCVVLVKRFWLSDPPTLNRP